MGQGHPGRGIVNLGIFAKTYTPREPAEVFAAVAAQGFSCTQFNLSVLGFRGLPETIPEEVCREIRDLARLHSLSIPVISGTANLIHPDRRRRSAAAAGVIALSKAAPRMGIPMVSLCTGTRDPEDMWRFHRENQGEEAWRDLRVSMEAILGAAGEMVFVIECEPGNVVSSPARALRLMEELRTPQVKIVFDGANIVSGVPGEKREALLDEALDLLGPRIALAHLKEIPPEGVKSVPLGRGLLDVPHYIRGLKKHCPQVPWIIHGITEEQVPESFGFIQSLCGGPA